jgi:hypothetical protein
VLEAEAAHAGGSGGVELVGPFGAADGAGPGDDGVGVGEAVGDEGGGGVEEAVAFGGVVVEAFDGLGGEDDAGVVAAEPFEQHCGVREPPAGHMESAITKRRRHI